MDKKSLILVVDDQDINLRLMESILVQKGYAIVLARDGKEAIEVAGSKAPEVILLDVMMPDITGIEVCKTLVEDPRSSNIPIILVTAKSGAEDTKEGLEAGAFDYVKKPFNRIELLARIHSALQLSEAHKLLIEAEKRNTFSATVVTTNHKIKQPLTLMSLSSTAIKREINKDEISREAILKKLNYIDIAIKEITDILNQLNAIKRPVFSEYMKNIRMVDVQTEKEETSD